MSTATLAEVKARLSAFIDQAKAEGPVAITRDGKVVAVIIAPIDDDDLENILLTSSPRFQAMLQQSRTSLQEGRGLSEDEFWPAVEADSNL